jgi:tetratricopeptide (TPR) repeat protein
MAWGRRRREASSESDGKNRAGRRLSYNAHLGGGLKSRALAAALLAGSLAAGCSSGSGGASTQIAFGADVARHGLWREAAFRFEKAIADQPRNARAHNDLAVALEASGDFARALEEYKKALELDPTNNYIRRNYARFAEFYTSYTRTTGKVAGGP